MFQYKPPFKLYGLLGFFWMKGKQTNKQTIQEKACFFLLTLLD